MDTKLRAAWKFFHAYAGGIVGESAIGALDLARAERWRERMEDAGRLTVRWVGDNEPYDHDGFTDEEIAAKFDSNQWTGPFGCVVSYGGDEYAASLWGIVLNPNGTSDPYARVVEAELCSEVMHDAVAVPALALDQLDPA
jgi:hypothetical protein